MNDSFDEIVSGLDLDTTIPELGIDLADIEMEGVYSITEVSDTELADLRQTLTDMLLDREEFMRPTTQEARDMHSLRNAVEVEMRQRGLQRQ